MDFPALLALAGETPLFKAYREQYGPTLALKLRVITSLKRDSVAGNSSNGPGTRLLKKPKRKEIDRAILLKSNEVYGHYPRNPTAAHIKEPLRSKVQDMIRLLHLNATYPDSLTPQEVKDRIMSTREGKCVPESSILSLATEDLARLKLPASRAGRQYERRAPPSTESNAGASSDENDAESAPVIPKKRARAKGNAKEEGDEEVVQEEVPGVDEEEEAEGGENELLISDSDVVFPAHAPEVDECGGDNDPGGGGGCGNDNAIRAGDFIPPSQLDILPSCTDPLLAKAHARTAAFPGADPELVEAFVAQHARIKSGDISQLGEKAIQLEESLADRRDKSTTLPSHKSPPIQTDYHLGSIGPAGSIPNTISKKSTVALVDFLTFALTGNLLSSSTHEVDEVNGKFYNPKTPVPAKLNMTTRVVQLTDSMIPHIVGMRLWLDANVWSRKANISVKANHPDQRRNFILTLQSIQAASPLVVRCDQALNVVQLLENFRPTGILKTPPLVPDPSLYSYLSLDGTLPAGYRPISLPELETWWRTHVLDIGYAMKYKCAAIFVKNFLGRSSCIIPFSCHPCAIDSSKSDVFQFNDAIDSYERVTMSIGTLFKQTKESLEQIAIYEKGLDPSKKEDKTQFHRAYDIGLGEIYFTPGDRRSNLIIIWKALAAENSRSTPFVAEDMSPGFILVLKHLLGNDALEHPPRHNRLNGRAPTYLPDMNYVLRFYYTNSALAATESKIEKGEFEGELTTEMSEELARYSNAREVAQWFARHRALGMSQEEIDSPRRFQIAETLRLEYRSRSARRAKGTVDARTSSAFGVVVHQYAVAELKAREELARERLAKEELARARLARERLARERLARKKLGKLKESEESESEESEGSEGSEGLVWEGIVFNDNAAVVDGGVTELEEVYFSITPLPVHVFSSHSALQGDDSRSVIGHTALPGNDGKIKLTFGSNRSIAKGASVVPIDQLSLDPNFPPIFSPYNPNAKSTQLVVTHNRLCTDCFEVANSIQEQVCCVPYLQAVRRMVIESSLKEVETVLESYKRMAEEKSKPMRKAASRKVYSDDIALLKMQYYGHLHLQFAAALASLRSLADSPEGQFGTLTGPARASFDREFVSERTQLTPSTSSTRSTTATASPSQGNPIRAGPALRRFVQIDAEGHVVPPPVTTDADGTPLGPIIPRKRGRPKNDSELLPSSPRIPVPVSRGSSVRSTVAQLNHASIIDSVVIHMQEMNSGAIDDLYRGVKDWVMPPLRDQDDGREAQVGFRTQQRDNSTLGIEKYYNHQLYGITRQSKMAKLLDS